MDERFMDLALEQARSAAAAGEIPVGAVIVTAEGTVVGSGFNQPIGAHDPTAHAEMMALRKAASSLKTYRLTGLTMYCTLEPCVMCAGAMVHGRISRLVYGAADPKAGAAGSIYNIVTDPRLNHQIETLSGVREQECRSLLQAFFKERRT